MQAVVITLSNTDSGFNWIFKSIVCAEVSLRKLTATLTKPWTQCGTESIQAAAFSVTSLCVAGPRPNQTNPPRKLWTSCLWEARLSSSVKPRGSVRTARFSHTHRFESFLMEVDVYKPDVVGDRYIELHRSIFCFKPFFPYPDFQI